MKIWYLSAYDQPRGQSSRTYDISKELINRGHQVTMFTNSYCHFTHVEKLSAFEKWRIEEIDGIRIVWMRTFGYTGNGFLRGLNMVSNVYRSIQIARIFSENPDVVIGPSVPIGTGFAASIIARIKGAAFVFEVRDIWPMALVLNGNISKNSFVYLVFRRIEKYLYQKAHRISSVLPLVYKHVAASGGNPENVTWISNGISLNEFVRCVPYEGGSDQLLTVMYVGGFSSAHDAISIVKAASILNQKGIKNFRFIFVGSGDKKFECQNLANVLGLPDVEFRDRVAKSDIPKLQEEADVLVACITDSAIFEFGVNLNKIYSYFASGRPVIFSGKAPNNPIALSGAGITTPPENPEMLAEALLRMLDVGVAGRKEMGKRAYRYAEDHFDIKRTAENFEKLLCQAITDKAGREL